MVEFYNWLTTTPLGLLTALGSLLLFFLLVAVLYERKTRRLYPDRDRRGTKAVAKAKAEKQAEAKVAAAKKANSSGAGQKKKPAQKPTSESEDIEEKEDKKAEKEE